MHVQSPGNLMLLPTCRRPSGGGRLVTGSSSRIAAPVKVRDPPNVLEPSTAAAHSHALRVESAVLQIKLPDDLQDAARSCGNHRLVQAGDHAGECSVVSLCCSLQHCFSRTDSLPCSAPQAVARQPQRSRSTFSSSWRNWWPSGSKGLRHSSSSRTSSSCGSPCSIITSTLLTVAATPASSSCTTPCGRTLQHATRRSRRCWHSSSLCRQQTAAPLPAAATQARTPLAGCQTTTQTHQQQQQQGLMLTAAAQLQERHASVAYAPGQRRFARARPRLCPSSSSTAQKWRRSTSPSDCRPQRQKHQQQRQTVGPACRACRGSTAQTGHSPGSPALCCSTTGVLGQHRHAHTCRVHAAPSRVNSQSSRA